MQTFRIVAFYFLQSHKSCQYIIPDITSHIQIPILPKKKKEISVNFSEQYFLRLF